MKTNQFYPCKLNDIFVRERSVQTFIIKILIAKILNIKYFLKIIRNSSKKISRNLKTLIKEAIYYYRNICNGARY